MKFFNKHFLIILNYNYNYFSFNIVLRKKNLFYAFCRKIFKRIIISLFYKFKFIFYGYNILIILNLKYNFNKYFKFFKNNKLIILEIICILNKILLFIR